MIRLYKKIYEFLQKYKPVEEVVEEVVEDEEKESEPEKILLVPNTSGSITIEFDAETGDFGVLASVNDQSEDCVKILSLLMIHLATGDITSFVYESLVGWADDDEEKKDFNERLGLEIIALTDELTKEKNKAGRKVAAKASEVFNYRKRD